jgi:hypothetical protein
VVYLEEGDVVSITREGYDIRSMEVRNDTHVTFSHI